jgi:hypothetical protein
MLLTFHVPNLILKQRNALRYHNNKVVYRSLVIVKTVKSRRLQEVGHVARMGETWNAYRILVGNLLENADLEDRRTERLTLR